MQVEISFRMRHLRPRPLLSVDPHLFANESLVGRLERDWHTEVVPLEGERFWLTVSPSNHFPSDYLFRLRHGARRWTALSAYTSQEVVVSPGSKLRLIYRPNLLYGYLLRGRLSVEVVAGTDRDLA